MSQITVSFAQEWIDERRKAGVRVIRELEKWVRSKEGVSLKSSTGRGLTIELPTGDREAFLKDLAERMKSDFGEKKPWEHAIFSGDLAGLDVPTVKKAAARPASAPAATETEAQPEPKSEAPQPPPPPKTGKKTDETQTLPPPDPKATLEEICSRVPIKHSRELEAYVRETAEVIPALQRLGVESSLWHQHLLLAVDAGYGRSEFLHALAKLYRSFGLTKNDLDKSCVKEFILLPPDSMFAGDGYRVSWGKLIEEVQCMQRSNQRNGISKVVLYIDISAWQDRLDASEVKVRLRRLNSLCGTFLIVFRVPFLEGHVLRGIADGLNDILNVRTIAVPPASVDDLVEYARGQLAESGFQLADDAGDAVEQCVLHEKVDNSFFGYKTMDKIVRKLIYEKALANCRGKADDRVIGAGDLKLASSTDSGDDPAEELKKLIGMKEVKQRIREVIAQIKMQKKLAAKGKKVARPAIHMVFTGSPGTGKTTVARILAHLMREEGILRKGHLVEVKGRDLCGEYVGMTAPKTSAICRDAYGSVLFIDEAYSLYRGKEDSFRDYGREALDTLVAEMENHRDDLCVIMAGYKDEMETMLQGNAGLKSRIPFEIEFPNYTREELEKIFFSMLDGNFEYEKDLKGAVHDFFAELPEEVFASKEFSNARFVRNLYERTWGKAASRQSLDGDGDMRILKIDLIGAMSDNEFKKLMKKNVDRRIGFGD